MDGERNTKCRSLLRRRHFAHPQIVGEPYAPFGQLHVDFFAVDQVEPVPDTTRVINPAWRRLDSQIRRQNALLSPQLVKSTDLRLIYEIAGSLNTVWLSESIDRS